MNVQKINANVRFSKAIGDGQYKTVEIGAEAQVMPGEKWEDAQATLYQALGAQLRTLWAANGHAIQEAPANPASGNGHKPTPPPAPAAPEHYCQAHGVPFKRNEKSGKVWYSHKAPDGKWCKE